MKNRLKELRVQNGMTQKEFAAAFNDFLKNNINPLKKFKQISYATISRWENGISEPKAEIWNELADFFNVSTNFIQGSADLNISLTGRIKTSREKAKLSKEELAEQYNMLIAKNNLPLKKINSYVINEWENAYDLPNNSETNVLSEVLHTSPAYLIGFDVPEKADSHEIYSSAISSRLVVDLIHKSLVQNMEKGNKFEYQAYYDSITDEDMASIIKDIMLFYKKELFKYGKAKYKPKK
ncbi:helix-turn-helix transcriptional regulator [Liquorilactobacillus capillatus]|uniref:HTH cro/C1-type domain-containing protein n=1 Tax=Liquorilactobacillus capillatus DSM 19910 TaxID=1423731 RepID=A0A0R1M5A4_9LACO|nr:helix-turn-helix domain-containing protein [Liquorilactobacillus capillatus]KRL03295.1 hypothetical protein FC81_GL000018 [Liquorilactobacillus capillatus DSM 19910]